VAPGLLNESFINSSNMENNKKGTATNRDGMGSTYAGTQTPNAKDPDGYQRPKATDTDEEKEDTTDPKDSKSDNETLGSEYHEPDSYGDQKPIKKTGNNKDNTGTAEGTPIR